MARKGTSAAAKDSNKASSTPSKGTGKAATRKAASDTPEQAPQNTSEAGTVEGNWNKDDFALTWSLLSAITDQLNIQNALYPPPGANTSTVKGGGKKKTEHHWLLCKAIFANHPEYKDVFAQVNVKKASERSKWSTKIKNRLRAMAKMVVEYKKILGSTGEGIKSADDIGDSFPESFRNKWEEVKAECPFFFEMRILIAQRPNYTPVGLGNAAMAEVDPDALSWDNIDVDKLLAKAAGEETGRMDSTEAADSASGLGGLDDDEPATEHSQLDDGDERSISSVSDSEEDVNTIKHAGGKRKAPASTPAAVEKSTKSAKTSSSTRSSTSAAVTPTPTPSKVKPTTVKGVLGGFADVIKTEEATRQQEIELAKERLRYSSKKLQAKTQVKLLREKQKHEMRTLQLQARKDVMIAQLNVRASISQGSGGGGGSHVGMGMGQFNLGAPNDPLVVPGGLPEAGFGMLGQVGEGTYNGPLPDVFGGPNGVQESYGMRTHNDGNNGGSSGVGEDCD
ncbi:hypothetical protein C8Q80DRAFT_1267475 [Daedaleopsis nitida]|nr:hypothetical protein C8Q80DRAFT_1267475 [Daedaleopsis nitida]